jgi:hypothetical protein
MTHITKKIDSENGLTVFTVTGAVSAAEIIEAIRDFYEGTVTSNVIWDFSGSDLFKITAADVKHIANLSANYADRRPSGKTAIVGSDALTYGLLRMYEMIKEFDDLPFFTETFRNADEALKWLTGTSLEDEGEK